MLVLIWIEHVAVGSGHNEPPEDAAQKLDWPEEHDGDDIGPFPLSEDAGSGFLVIPQVIERHRGE